MAILLLAVVANTACTQTTHLSTTNAYSKNQVQPKLDLTISKNTTQQAIAQIKATLIAYQTAMAKADTDAIMAIFQDNAVIEFQAKPTLQGKDAIHHSYEQAFAVMDFTGIDYVPTNIEIYGDTAIVRTTHPIGATVYHKEQGKTLPDRNREVFVFKRHGNDWKIAYYMYNQKS
ncbi:MULTISPECIES: YybH family protein [unclassified Acinetobacter]|uniref:YybH family protein n=1 Tax=unclassified Acinetobacter TaxID=196816 RepID=UPI0035B8574B